MRHDFPEFSSLREQIFGFESAVHVFDGFERPWKCDTQRRLSMEAQMAIRTTRSVGMILLAVWLILTGLTTFVAFPLPAAVSGALALIAGVLILIGM